jgi:uncharacterized surface anchored protein
MSITKKFTSLILAALMLFGVLTAGGAPAFAADGAENYPLNSIVIKIEDIVTHEMLGGARFEIYYNNAAQSGGYGTLVATVDSDGSGVIVISGIPSGYYIVRQTAPPNNYHLSMKNEQNCYIKPDGTSVEELVFSNYRYGGLVVFLSDKDTGVPVAGAQFSVTDVSGKAVGNAADGLYTTDSRGEFYLENLAAGDYKITQLTAAQGYAMDSAPNSRTVRLQHTNADQSVFRAEFSNSPLGTLLVRLKDSITKIGISGAKFNVKLSGGEDLGEFTAGAQGTFTLPKIARGTYIVTQISAPAGYLVAGTAKTQYVNYVNTYAVDFENQPKSGLYVVKYDADTKAPLKDAKFRVEQEGTLIGTYTTNADGAFSVPNLEPGWYAVSEYAAPQGYILDDTPKSVQVISEKLHKMEFENKKLASIQIIKTDEYSGDPLQGAKFRITTQAGEFVADVVTDASGKASIGEVQPGWYVIAETKAPGGYLITEPARTVEVKATVPCVVMVTNRAENNLEIVKLDYFSRAPLAGATFKVEHSSGANVGTFRTDGTGKILVGTLTEDTYVVSEVAAPQGYQLDSEPQTIVVQGGKLLSLEFLDKPLSGIEIIKTDEFSHAPLIGATFTVERDNGEKLGVYKTDTAGKIIVSGLENGTYVVAETIAPTGYVRDEIPKTVIVKSGKLTTVEFTNKPLSGIQIVKTDKITHAPLMGAIFTVERTNGERVIVGTTNGSGKYATDVSGKILIPGIEPGVYIVSEVQAPTNYLLDSQPQTVEVKSDKLTVAEFVDAELPSLYIRKVDSATGGLVAGAHFTVTAANGAVIAEVVSLSTGAVVVPHVQPGIYTITETKAPAGYALNDPMQSVEVRANGSVYYNSAVLGGNTATFANNPLNTLEIVKLDSVTHNPLSNATFGVTKANGESIGTYRTDASGKILITEIKEGTYVVSEIAAPQGYILNSAPQNVNIGGGKLVSVEFLNKPLSGIQIVKLDSVSHQPLQGAKFSVTKANGEVIGSYVTEADGKVLISNLDEGVYVVGEIYAPDGYQLDDSPKNVTVISGKLATVEFVNKPFSGITIQKLDAFTKAPLTGATFTVERDNGEKIGSYKTDAAGKIIVSGLTEGTYIVSETAAPDGYILDAVPQTVIIKSGKLTAVEFTNKPLAGLKIIKLDSVSRNPIEGVEFSVSKMDGERVEDDFRATAFKTDKTGQIFIPQLENGYYTVTETRAADGYILDSEPKTVLVQSGKTTLLEVENAPMSGLLIVKTDEATRKPLAGVKFEVKKPSGEQVGIFTTDKSGQIRLTDVPAGALIVTETAALDGYEIDSAAREVTIYAGKQTTLEVTNRQKAGLRLLKIDSVTKKGIYGVEFMVFDANDKQVGTFLTDNNGVIDFAGILTEGHYTIRETRSADGYYRDDMPRTIDFKSGKVTEVVWENTPQMGQIQITKLSGDDNEQNGLPKGTPLAGAVFEIYQYKSGNLVDRFVSGTDGRAVSKPLPIGRYTVKEVQAPQWYRLSTEAMDIEIEFATQIIKRDFLNYSANTGVKIRKTGSYEAMPGDTIRYDIKEMSNTSSVPLTDFFWSDVIPADAVRLNKIVTGTYNQSLKYKILVTTNKGDTRVIADNLSTTQNNVIDCRNAALGLANDEYVTSFTLIFGTVKAGFCKVSEPQIYVTVNKSLANGYEFGNKVDCGGKYNDGEFVISGSTWVTRIYAQPQKLPRTGY